MKNYGAVLDEIMRGQARRREGPVPQGHHDVVDDGPRRQDLARRPRRDALTRRHRDARLGGRSRTVSEAERRRRCAKRRLSHGSLVLRNGSASAVAVAAQRRPHARLRCDDELDAAVAEHLDEPQRLVAVGVNGMCSGPYVIVHVPIVDRRLRRSAAGRDRVDGGARRRRVVPPAYASPRSVECERGQRLGVEQVLELVEERRRTAGRHRLSRVRCYAHRPSIERRRPPVSTHRGNGPSPPDEVTPGSAGRAASHVATAVPQLAWRLARAPDRGTTCRPRPTPTAPSCSARRPSSTRSGSGSTRPTPRCSPSTAV